MRGRRRIASLALVALGFMAVAPQVVQTQEQTQGNPPQARDQLAIFRAAGADAEQLDQIRAIVKDFEELATVKRELLRNHLRDMRALSLQPDPKPENVLAKQDEINKVQSEMGTEKIKMLLKVRDILRPEQKQRLVQLMQAGPGSDAPNGASPNGI